MSKKSGLLLVAAALAMAASFLAGVKFGASSGRASIEVAPVADAAAPARPADRALPALPAETPAATATPAPTPAAPAATGEDPLPKYYGEKINNGPRTAKIVALTFDDGPSTAYNARFISTLKQEKATATFFMIGRNAQANPELVKNVADAGLEIGIHTINHPNPAHTSAEQMREEMLGECDLIQGITGQRPRLYRPPYGAVTSAERQIARENNLVMINWSIDTEDWRAKDAESIHARVMKNLHPGAIILMHEIKGNTIEILPRLIQDIRAQGYEFVTVSRMLDELAKAPPEAVGGGSSFTEPAPAPQAIPIGELKGMMRAPQTGKPARKSNP
ncbi:MAG: polysaccharide deacetylase family protein [Candidatus Sumerlaeia bacterium]